MASLLLFPAHPEFIDAATIAHQFSWRKGFFYSFYVCVYVSVYVSHLVINRDRITPHAAGIALPVDAPLIVAFDAPAHMHEGAPLLF